LCDPIISTRTRIQLGGVCQLGGATVGSPRASSETRDSVAPASIRSAQWRAPAHSNRAQLLGLACALAVARAGRRRDGAGYGCGWGQWDRRNGRIVWKSQSVLIVIHPIISTRTRSYRMWQPAHGVRCSRTRRPQHAGGAHARALARSLLSVCPDYDAVSSKWRARRIIKAS
jgi:hypothetical protein